MINNLAFLTVIAAFIMILFGSDINSWIMSLSQTSILIMTLSFMAVLGIENFFSKFTIVRKKTVGLSR